VRSLLKFLVRLRKKQLTEQEVRWPLMAQMFFTGCLLYSGCYSLFAVSSGVPALKAADRTSSEMATDGTKDVVQVVCGI
jgi:hypothetical protein